MIQVHDIFVCKPGNASKVAKLFKEVMGNNKEVVGIMTDMTGQFNRVIMVSQYKDMAEYQKSWEAYMNPTKEMKEEMAKMEGYQDKYLTGSREIYKIW
ncbi:MAG: NIPSNAP family protein [Acidobacteriaceae bacterium]